jgi:hypothetical protein
MLRNPIPRVGNSVTRLNALGALIGLSLWLTHALVIASSSLGAAPIELAVTAVPKNLQVGSKATIEIVVKTLAPLHRSSLVIYGGQCAKIITTKPNLELPINIKGKITFTRMVSLVLINDSIDCPIAVTLVVPNPPMGNFATSASVTLNAAKRKPTSRTAAPTSDGRLVVEPMEPSRQ